ncbi:hypothetical protein Hanom_Chr09g00857191 [Helianthus anomalus]
MYIDLCTYLDCREDLCLNTLMDFCSYSYRFGEVGCSRSCKQTVHFPAVTLNHMSDYFILKTLFFLYSKECECVIILFYILPCYLLVEPEYHD